MTKTVASAWNSARQLAGSYARHRNVTISSGYQVAIPKRTSPTSSVSEGSAAMGYLLGNPSPGNDPQSHRTVCSKTGGGHRHAASGWSKAGRNTEHADLTDHGIAHKTLGPSLLCHRRTCWENKEWVRSGCPRATSSIASIPAGKLTAQRPQPSLENRAKPVTARLVRAQMLADIDGDSFLRGDPVPSGIMEVWIAVKGRNVIGSFWIVLEPELSRESHPASSWRKAASPLRIETGKLNYPLPIPSCPSLEQGSEFAIGVWPLDSLAP